MTRWGAYPDDWAHLDLMLGLGADLLPVVANPAAVVSERSSLKALGKVPSVYNREGNVVGIKDWTAKQATTAEIDRWAANPDLGICLQTRRVRALDIDIEDEGLASAVFSFIVERLGVFPSTRSRENSGKCLIPFWLDGEFSKRSFKCEGGLVELLAGGQQFICHGTHSSGVRYRWSHDAPPEPVRLTVEAFEALWAGLVVEFATEPERVSLGSGGRGSGVDLEGVDDPVAAFLIETRAALSVARDGSKVFVACPWIEGHSVDSGETEAAWLVAGTRGFQQGHFECLHASCSGRTDDEFKDAVGCGVADDFEALPVAYTNGHDRSGDALSLEEVERSDVVLPPLERDKKGRAEAVIANLEAALACEALCGAKVAFDAFQGALMICLSSEGAWRTLTDVDNTKMRVRLEKGVAHFKPIGREMMRDALNAAGEDNEIDTGRDWLLGLPAWDGVPRVASFWTQYFGAADTPYVRAVGLYAWTALAGRLLDPGCQADMIPALVGRQGEGKSMGLKAMAPWGGAFAKINLSLKDADLSRKIRGLSVGEVAELRGLGTRDGESIKDWITFQVERWTPKFMEFETVFPRRCIFFATSNKAGFLADETGERRWLPMMVGKVDVAGIGVVHAQLWTEARELWKAGGIAWREAEALARDEHGAFKEIDVWGFRVEAWLSAPDGLSGDDRPGDRALAAIEILEGAIGGGARSYGRPDEMRLAKIMRGLGYDNPSVWHNGKTQRLWVKSA